MQVGATTMFSAALVSREGPALCTWALSGSRCITSFSEESHEGGKAGSFWVRELARAASIGSQRRYARCRRRLKSSAGETLEQSSSLPAFAPSCFPPLRCDESKGFDGDGGDGPTTLTHTTTASMSESLARHRSECQVAVGSRTGWRGPRASVPVCRCFVWWLGRRARVV
jgi:hypothetical protein